MTSTEQIIKFNADRHLVDFSGETEVRLLVEELEELKEAIAQGNLYDTIDALNDLRVVATGALWKLGQDPELSLQETCKEILSREGAIGDDGKWYKDKNQDPDTLYKADYNLSINKD